MSGTGLLTVDGFPWARPNAFYHPLRGFNLFGNVVSGVPLRFTARLMTVAPSELKNNDSSQVDSNAIALTQDFDYFIFLLLELDSYYHRLCPSPEVYIFAPLSAPQ
jgi:hypothetical protein